jgi:Matrixin
MSRNDRARPRGGVALLTAGAALLTAGAAHAYCRTSSCMEGMPHTAAVCDPPASDDCGTPIAWPQPCVGFSVQENASREVTFAQTETVMKQAFASWTTAACPGGGTPRMQVTEAAPAICDQHEYNQTAGNANIILYHDDAWPYEGSPNTLALTTVTYALDTGEIYDADMELNSADNHFTIGDTDVDFDLLSIVTHETGHFLGLAHSHDMNATMWPDYVEHSTNLRDLSPDDIAAICDVYPPGPAITDCDPTPRHGFSTLCADAQPTASGACCTVAPGVDGGSGGGRGPLAGTLAALGGVLLVSRRRKRRE